MTGVKIFDISYRQSDDIADDGWCMADYLNRKIARYPTLTIFGECRSGESACVHVNAAFSYFYVKIESRLVHAIGDGVKFCRALEVSHTKCYFKAKRASKKPVDSSDDESEEDDEIFDSERPIENQVIYRVEKVRKKDFYGMFMSFQGIVLTKICFLRSIRTIQNIGKS